MLLFSSHLRPRYVHVRTAGPDDSLLVFESRRLLEQSVHRTQHVSSLPIGGGELLLFYRHHTVVAACISDTVDDYLALEDWLKGLLVLLGAPKVTVYEVVREYCRVREYTQLFLHCSGSSGPQLAGLMSGEKK